MVGVKVVVGETYGVFVPVVVIVGVRLGVEVIAAVGVAVTVPVWVAVAVADAVGEGVAVPVAEAVGEAVAVADEVGVRVGLGVVVGVQAGPMSKKRVRVLFSSLLSATSSRKSTQPRRWPGPVPSSCRVKVCSAPASKTLSNQSAPGMRLP